MTRKLEVGESVDHRSIYLRLPFFFSKLLEGLNAEVGLRGPGAGSLRVYRARDYRSNKCGSGNRSGVRSRRGNEFKRVASSKTEI